MFRLTFRALFTVILVAFSPAAASACINDGNTVREEREFKSSYIDRKPEPSSVQPPSGNSPLLVFSLSGIGIALLAGAGVITLGLSIQPKADA
jgi:hypothetical protein